MDMRQVDFLIYESYILFATLTNCNIWRSFFGCSTVVVGSQSVVVA